MHLYKSQYLLCLSYILYTCKWDIYNNYSLFKAEIND